MGIGDWGLGIGDWGVGPMPNLHTPLHNRLYPIMNQKKLIRYLHF